ncbi:MAG: glycerophosphodiester phosphodiesterase [Spirochaetes bacterium]|uniref:Glycerophosphodiester phosphodiesterase n=1 Tax=Candidatus Aphodenecus pullistercoris TaxID=2840669 RepID=A0A9D9EA07_9SPIR|nr:glycerophosphodiester phosphodiesterase [Candidatus Aphodenecus pullistercoris]
MSHHSFLEPMPRVIAHRGDSRNYPENTLPAFESAVRMGIDVVETDIHLTKDGVLVIWHDPTLERNTDGRGRIEDHTLEELRRFDAGYTFTQDGGRTFPFRGKGVRICTLAEALEHCPGQRFNIDLKTKCPEIVDEFIKVIREHDAVDRVVGASFHLSNLKRLRRLAPDFLTSVTTAEVVPLLFRQKTHTLPKAFKRKIIFQIPMAAGPVKVVTPAFVKAMHQRGAVVMVWTINDEETMRRLFAMGVDSVMTDDPALVIKVADEMNIRKDPLK